MQHYFGFSMFRLKPQTLSHLYYRLHPFINILPLRLQVKVASAGRQAFMKCFSKYSDFPTYVSPAGQEKKLWGLTFRNSLFNSAGMFKNGEGYDIIARMGAGAYLGGTSTANPRLGNSKNNINLPFITLPDSQVSINWLGLPNQGDEILHQKIITRQKEPTCPIGWSIMRSPDYNEEEGMQHLINSLWLYHNNSTIDFLELNESCPNVKSGGGSIIPRLGIISSQFLNHRSRRFPVILKLSNDIDEQSLRIIIKEAITCGFDGINLGNTSTNYTEIRKFIKPKELAVYNYFTANFGGGISGKVLNENSLTLCRIAVDEIKKIQPAHEFHVIRSGGISTWNDIKQSEEAGIALNQWYTGFFDNFTKYGYNVYQKILAESFTH